MSLIGVTYGVARVVATVPGLRAVYAARDTDQPEVSSIKSYPGDIPAPPSALVTHERFTVEGGSFERWAHFVSVEIYMGGTDGAAAELAMYDMVTRVVAAFRSNVELFGQATVAVVTGGGPATPEEVNGKPFMVYPITVRALAATAQTYT